MVVQKALGEPEAIAVRWLSLRDLVADHEVAGGDSGDAHEVVPLVGSDALVQVRSSRWDLLAVWSREMNAFAWQCYLGDLYGTDDVPAYAAPARARDLARLAPAYVHVGGLDGFLHEDVAYAARLLAAGVSAELHVLPLVPHGFDQVAPDAAVTATANALSHAALARVLN